MSCEPAARRTAREVCRAKVIGAPRAPSGGASIAGKPAARMRVRQINNAAAIGKTPPTTKMARQLHPSGSPSATSPARKPPNGMPAMITVTELTRFAALVASEASAMKFGSAPPSPKPVSNRAKKSEFGPIAAEVRSEQMPKRNKEIASMLLRPVRSAVRPPTAAPRNRPSVAALKMTEACPVEALG